MILSFAYNKGGVGKTTITYNVGGILSTKGYRVLLIDMDGQCNLSEIAGLKNPEHTIYDALAKGEDLMVYPLKENLACCPSSINMNALDADMAMKPGREYYLKRLLKDYQRDFDFVLCDCPPSIGIATMNALTASDYVIIPVEGRYLSVSNIGVMVDLISDVKKMVNPELEILGVVMSRFKNRERVANQLQKEIQESIKLPMFNSVIRESVHIGEAPMYREDILSYSKGSLGASDFIRFVDEILERANYERK